MSENLCIVLKASDYKDNHKMVTFFSREEGRVSVMVPGAKSLKNGMASASQPLSCGFAVIEEKQGRKYLKQFDLKKSYYSISGNYDAFVAACELVRFVDKVLSNIDDFDGLFIIFVNAINALSNGVNSEQVINYFTIRFLDYLGVGPELDTCVACGREVDKADYFSIENGGIICSDCRANGSSVEFTERMRRAIKNALEVKPVNFVGDNLLEGDLTDLLAEYLEYMTELSVRTGRK